MVRTTLIGVVVLACMCTLPREAKGQTVEVVEVAVPGYPRLPSGGREGGEVKVEVTIATTGTVRTARAISGPDRLKPAAESAARRWRFSTSGQPIRTAELAFAFSPRPGIGEIPTIAAVFTAPYRVEVFAEAREVITIADPEMVDVEKQRQKKKR